MKRFWPIIVFFVLIALPIIILIYANFESIQKKFKIFTLVNNRTVSQKYTATSTVKEYKPKVVNTAFLDYIIANMNVFDANAIADPKMYRGDRNSKVRHTVSRVEIELVPEVNQFLLAIDGKTNFASKGSYIVKDDTLVIQVSIDPNQIVTGGTSSQYSQEDIYLKTALQVLVYAVGTPQKRMEPEKLIQIDKDLREYLYTGIFERPIIIEKKD